MKNIYLLFLLMTCVLFSCNNASEEKVKKEPQNLLNQEALDKEPTYNSLEEALKNPLKVYKLSLQNMGLKELNPDITKLEKLQVLYLDGNPALNYAEVFKKIASLTNLHDISLANNQLKNLPEEIEQLANLNTIYLDENPQLDFEKAFDNLSKLSGLKELSLIQNQLKKLPENISGLKNLKKLITYC